MYYVPGSCSNFNGAVRSLHRSCFTPYSFATEDKTSYSTSWLNLNNNSDSDVINQSPWIYHSAGETGAPLTRGRHRLLSGGGYVIPMWSRRTSTMIVSLERLRKASWVDEQTRTMFLEFTVFNPSDNLFASVQLCFEFTDFGTIDSSHYDIGIFKLHTLANKGDIYRLLFECAYAVAINVYVLRTLRLLWMARRSLSGYCLSVSTIVQWIIIILSYSSAAAILWLEAIVTRMSEEIRDGGKRRFISFHQVIRCNDAISSMLSVVHFLLMINIFRWSVFIAKGNMLFAFSVSRARRYMLPVGCLFVVVFVVNVLSSRLLFGSYCDDYKDFGKAVLHVASLFRYRVYCSGNNDCVNEAPCVGLLFFGFAAFFVVLLWRLLVLVCGIGALCDAAPVHEKADLQFVDFLACRMMVGIGYWNMDDYIRHVAVQRHWRVKTEPTQRRRRRIRQHGQNLPGDARGEARCVATDTVELPRNHFVATQTETFPTNHCVATQTEKFSTNRYTSIPRNVIAPAEFTLFNHEQRFMDID